MKLQVQRVQLNRCGSCSSFCRTGCWVAAGGRMPLVEMPGGIPAPQVTSLLQTYTPSLSPARTLSRKSLPNTQGRWRHRGVSQSQFLLRTKLTYLAFPCATHSLQWPPCDQATGEIKFHSMRAANLTAQQGWKHKQLHAPFILSAVGVSDCFPVSSSLSNINNLISVTRSSGKAACCNTRAPASSSGMWLRNCLPFWDRDRVSDFPRDFWGLSHER